MNCPQCGSDNTRKYSILYEEGTSHGKSEGFSDHASYETEHFSQTPLAKRCAPPKEPEIGAFLSIVGFIFAGWFGYKIGGLVGGFWWGVGAFVLSLIALNFLWRLIAGNKKMDQFHLKYQAWERSWLCTKCGNGFLSLGAKGMDAKAQTLIAQIETAFKGVERDNGISIHEAREIDYHSSRPKRLAARALDIECKWQDVSPEVLSQNDHYLVFLDAKGMRYYLPALMTWYLKSNGEIVGEELILALAFDDSKLFSLLSNDQSCAVSAFLRHVAATDDYNAKDAKNACTKYWNNFATQRT